MKKLWIVVVYLMAGLALSCDPTPTIYKDRLLHLQQSTWYYHTEAMYREVMEDLPLDSNNDLEFFMATLERLADQHFIFSADSSLQLFYEGESVLTGQYYLSEDGKELTFELPGLVATPHRILYLDQDSMYLAADSIRGQALPKIFISKR